MTVALLFQNKGAIGVQICTFAPLLLPYFLVNTSFEISLLTTYRPLLQSSPVLNRSARTSGRNWNFRQKFWPSSRTRPEFWVLYRVANLSSAQMMSFTHGQARTGADPLRPLAVRALRVWKEGGWPARNEALRRGQYPAPESPDGLSCNPIPSSSGHFAENIQNFLKSFPGVFFKRPFSCMSFFIYTSLFHRSLF